MSLEEIKQWAVETGNVQVVAELILEGYSLEDALRRAYKNKSKGGKKQ